jgi:pimeloyl-ACP methyl ester carboxylesterase
MVGSDAQPHLLPRAATAVMEMKMHKFLSVLMVAAAVTAADAAPAGAADVKPTIVLVHGAFADSSGWNGVIARLERDGFKVVAAANPLRGVAADAADVSALVKSQQSPVVLVGHSYGGPVITEAANSTPNVKALVYVAGFLPAPGESAFTLSVKFPGSTLGDALSPVSLPGGGKDLYIQPAKFHAQFAADVPAAQARLMAATQRPVTEAALSEPSGAAAWMRLPSYVIYGSDDRNIPAAVMSFMATRAQARKTVVLDGASHALMVSQPDKVAALIEDAANAK